MTTYESPIEKFINRFNLVSKRVNVTIKEGVVCVFKNYFQVLSDVDELNDLAAIMEEYIENGNPSQDEIRKVHKLVMMLEDLKIAVRVFGSKHCGKTDCNNH